MIILGMNGCLFHFASKLLPVRKEWPRLPSTGSAVLECLEICCLFYMCDGKYVLNRVCKCINCVIGLI